MAYSDVKILRDADGIPIPQYYDSVEGVFKPSLTEGKSELDSIKVELEAIKNGTLNVSDAKLLDLETELQLIKDKLNDIININITGDNREIYVPTLVNRPDANTVDVGTFCMIIDTGDIYQSDGTSWVVR